jgi:phage terminase small subunit
MKTSDLPRLTLKQRKWVQGVQDGLNQSDAYRKAYDAENMKPEAIWVAASRLASEPKVALWLERMKEGQFKKIVITRDSHLKRLAELSTAAQAAGQYGPAVTAAKLQGDVTGLYVSRVLMDLAPKSPAELERELAKVRESLAGEEDIPLKVVEGGRNQG